MDKLQQQHVDKSLPFYSTDFSNFTTDNKESIFKVIKDLQETIKSNKTADEFISYIVNTLSDEIISHHQENMCWNLSDEQTEIVDKRYLMTYADGIQDKSLETISIRMQRTISSQLTLYTDNLEHIKKFDSLLTYLFNSRLLVLNTPQMFNLGMGLNHDLFFTTNGNNMIYNSIDKLTYEDYVYIYTNINRSDFTTQACFILDMEDSIESIFETLKKQSMIQKAAGGVGFNIGRLRPKNQYIKTTNSSSSGSLSFLQVFNETGKVIKQGNKRRWQGMQVLQDIYDKFWEYPCSVHPDILEFINAKRNNTGETILQSFNISVGINNSKDLAEKQKTNDTTNLVNFTFQGETLDKVLQPSMYSSDKTKLGMPQKELLNIIQENAHKCGDPGLIFLDKINKYNPLRDSDLYMVQTNPCGERPGISSQKYGIYDTCDLGHLDITKMLIKSEDGLFKLNASLVYSLSYISQYVLDLLHDLLMYPTEEVKKGVTCLRSVGLGFYGLQGALMLMGIPYDSEEQRKMQYFVMKLEEMGQSNMSFEAQKQLYPYLFQKLYESSDIPTQHIWDKNFADFEYEDEIDSFVLYNKNSKTIKSKDEKNIVFNELRTLYHTKQPRRNINLTTIQPTGTTSIIGQTQILGDTGSGVEPLYSLNYRRFITNLDGTKTEQIYISKILFRLLDKTFLKNILPQLQEYYKNLYGKELKVDNTDIENLIQEQKQNPTSTVWQEKSILFSILKKWVEQHYTQMEISYMNHLLMQEQVQKSCSSQISKTINMKNDQKVKDVLEQYLYALTSDYIKGITVYRDGSLQVQVLEAEQSKETQKKKTDLQEKLSFLKFNINVDEKTGRIKPKVKPAIMESLKKTVYYKNESIEKKFHIEIGFTDNNEPFEVFVRTTESSQDMTNMFNLYGRLISTQFRSGVDINEVLKQQKKVKNWKNDYDPIIEFITTEVEELISISKKSIKQKKQIIEDINEQFIKQSFEPGCSQCGE